MTAAQVAVNAAAIRNLASRLERMGCPGDTHAEAEHIALNLLADGYRPLEKPVPLRGPGASRRAIDDARKTLDDAIRARKTGTATNDTTDNRDGAPK